MMRGWAERQLRTLRGRTPGLLRIAAPVQHPSVTRDLTGEPMIPRRGTWGTRARFVAPSGAASPEAEPLGIASPRVKWNLTG